MLIYNIFIFTVAFLLYLDYLVHKYDVHIVNGESRLSFGNGFMYLALGAMIFFAGFRYEIGYDFPKYAAGYLHDSELDKWEPVFNFFVRLIREVNFGLDMQGMFLFFSSLIIIILYKALKNLTPTYRLGILLYLLIPAFYLNSFSVIRQGVAMVILLYGLQYITGAKPNYKKYALMALLAFMFHYSSIIVSFSYLIGTKFFNRVHSWVIYLFFILVSIFLSFVNIAQYILIMLPGRFHLYAYHTADISILKLLIVNGFFLFFMVQKDHIIKTRLDRYLFNSIFIGLVLFNFFSQFADVSRLAQYFLMSEIVLVPMYLRTMKDILLRKVLLIIFLVYYLFNFNYALYRDINYPGQRPHFLVPYKNYVFEEHKTHRNMNMEAWYNYIQEVTEKEEESMK